MLHSPSLFGGLLFKFTYRIYLSKRRPRKSAAVPMRRLFEEFCITIKALQMNTKTVLEISFHQKCFCRMGRTPLLRP